MVYSEQSNLDQIESFGRLVDPRTPQEALDCPFL
jgi:hypothetical protein